MRTPEEILREIQRLEKQAERIKKRATILLIVLIALQLLWVTMALSNLLSK